MLALAGKHCVLNEECWGVNSIRAYLLSVMTAAVICAVVKQLFKEKNGVSSVIHLLAGVFLAVTMLRPVLSVSFSSVMRDIADYENAALLVIEEGQHQAEASLAAIIKEETQAYILEQAERLKLDVSVDVRLSNDDLPVPVEVTVQGAVSPYARAYLANIIEQNIGISEENQIWIS